LAGDEPVNSGSVTAGEAKKTSTDAPFPVTANEAKKTSTDAPIPVTANEAKKTSTDAPMPVTANEAKKTSTDAPIPKRHDECINWKLLLFSYSQTCSRTRYVYLLLLYTKAGNNKCMRQIIFIWDVLLSP
jgi:hypothetical protein